MTRARSTIDRDRLLADLAAGRRIALLVGPAGAGKSWLADAVLQALAAAGAVTGRGKYAEGGDQSAYGPIVAALSGTIARTLDRQFDPQRALASLTGALGVHLEVLLAIGLTVPGIDRTSTLQALADRRQWPGRIGAAVLALLAWLDGFGERPALLIDDWDRAPGAAVALLRLMTSATLARPLTLILTGRTPGELAQLPVEHAARYRLGARNNDEVAAMLGDALGDRAQAAAILKTLGSDIPRLPFDIAQLAAVARDTGWLAAGAERAAPLVYAPADRIAALSDRGRAAALALALAGDGVASATLAAALGCGDGDGGLSELVDAGIAQIDRACVGFRHDRLREAALAAGDAAAVAAAMAERLQTADPDEPLSLSLRLLGGLDGAAPSRWRAPFALGAARARASGDAQAADRFAEAALALSQREPAADRDDARAILREAMLAAASRDDPVTRERAAKLLASAVTDVERFCDSELAITALRFAGDADGAWDVLCAGLASVGIRMPERATLRHLLPAMLAWQLRDRLPLTRRLDPALIEAFTGMATAAATTAYHRDPALTALIGFRASTLVARDATSSCYWHGVDAFLYGIANSPSRAAAAGARALVHFDQQVKYRAHSLYQAVFFGTLWRERLAEGRPQFRTVTEIALAEGDPTMAAYGIRADIMAGWRSERHLPRLLDQARIALSGLTALGEQSFVDEMASFVALLEGLTGKRRWSAELWRDDLPARNHVIDLELANLSGQWRRTLRLARSFAPLARDYALQHEAILLRFHTMLATLRCDRPVARADLRYLERAARLNPADHRAKVLLIAAERLRLAGKPCADAYAVALAAAEASDARLIAGLTAQCAADAMEERGEPARATQFNRRAAAIWRAWGLHPQARGAGASAIADMAARADAAERADRAKTRLLAHVGHELRTPLQALQAQLDLAAAEGRAIAPDTLQAVLASLNTVVDDLDMMGDLAQRSDPADESVDIVQLLQSEMALWPGLDPGSLRIALQRRMLRVPGNRVRQIVRNLLSNAIKYGAGMPEVVVADAAGRDDHVLITVADRGPGLPPDLIETLFAPFERGTHQGDGRGAGLGLALSRRIAQRLGGELVARNREDGGACFSLTIAAPAASQGPADAPTAPLELLLVEDTALIRQAVAALLRRAGHRVHEAVDAASALSALAGRTFDAIVLDVGLPDASGLTVLDRIRRDHGAMPVLLLTAAVDRELIERCATDPATRILRKPVSAATLATTLGALCNVPAGSVPDGAPPEYPRMKRSARREIRARGIRLARAPRPDAAAAHQLAGLAAQFGWSEVASAAEALDASAAASARLHDAVSAMD